MNRILRTLFLISLIALICPNFAKAQSVSITGGSSTSGCDSVYAYFSSDVTGCSSATSMWYFRHFPSGYLDSSLVSGYMFNRIGTYNVILKVTCDSSIIYDSLPGYITVNPTPVINFSTTNPSVDTNLICGPHTVTFVNTSVADTSCAHTWTWILTGPATTVVRSGYDFSYTFSNVGDYSLTLLFFAPSCGCFGSVTKTSYIRIDSPAVACFTSSGRSSVFCAPPATVTYDASCTSGGASSYEWHFGDGTITTTTAATTSHTFTSPGTYSDTVFVVSPGGCRSFFRIRNNVFVGNLTAFMLASDDTVCQGTSVTFRDSTTVGGTPTSFEYKVTHVSTGTVVDRRYTSTATFNFSYAAPYDAGLYTIEETVIDTGGCTSTYSRNVFVRVSPRITSLTADTVYKCAPPMRVRFGSSVSPSGTYTYTWAFGGGAAATTSGIGLTSPTHTYTALGTYSPSLRVTDRFGCTDDTTASGTIALSPASFSIVKSVDSGCSPLRVGFVINMLYPSGLAYNIDSVTFSDSTAPCIGSACADSAHTFTRGGRNLIVFHWRLPAYLGGCSGSDTTSVVVGFDRPDRGIRVTADTVCPNTLIEFFDSCTTCSSRSWILPEGYTDDSSYTNILLADGDVDYRYTIYRYVRGCGDTIRGSLRVDGPFAGSVQTSVPRCTRQDSISLRSLDSRGASSYVWTIIGPTSATTRTVTSTAADGYTTYRLPSIGTYTIYGIVTGSPPRRCTDTTSRTTYRYDTVATLDWSIVDTTVCVGETVTFNGPVVTATDGSTSGYSTYEWSFGDGSTPDPYTTYGTPGATVTHSYTAPGLYTIRLVIQNSSGCRVSALNKRVIVRGPTGGFTHTPEPVCAGDLVTFTNNNRSYAAAITLPSRWNLNVSGSVPDTLLFRSSFTYRYMVAGTYTVSLRDSDAVGCVTTTTSTVTVVKPAVSFYSSDTVDNLCRNIPISFHCDQSGFLYSWNFGDGTGFSRPSATAQDTSYTYRSEGRYSVTLTITSTGTGGSSSFPAGCSASVTKSNYINIRAFNYTSTNFGDGNVASCPPLRIVRFADVPGGIPRDFTTYKWTVVSGMGIDTFSGPLLNTSLFTSGLVTVTLTGTTIRGCVDTEVTNYFIGGPSGYITVTPDSGCVPVNVRLQFVDTGTTAASSRYIWLTCPFGSFTSTTPDTTLAYTTPGSYCPPIVTIQSGSCVVNIRSTDSIRIFSIPDISIVPNPVPVLCYNSSTVISAVASETITSYTWAPAIGLTCSTCESTSVGPLTNTTYTVTGTSIHGCVDTAIVSIRVDSPLKITITGKERVCQGICDTLVASGVAGALYAWEGVGISCAVCDTNVICINKTRTFKVTATNPYGCQTTDSFTVIIDTIPVLHVDPDPAYVCKYSPPTQLNATGASTYVWKPNIGLSCDSCANPFTDVATNIIYSITGTTIYGCKDSISIPVTVYDTTKTGINPDTSICIGDAAQLTASGGIAYRWIPTNTLSDPNSRKPTANPVVTTTYTVYITENVCFSDTLTTTVRVVPLPILNVTPGREIIAGTQVQLYAIADTILSKGVKLTKWFWTPADTTLTCFNCPRPIATPIVTTTYNVTATTDEGCAGYGTVTIRVLCNEDQVFIPNTFTPNGDGVNDRFYISGKGLGSIKRLSVYSRWGELMFESLNVRSNDAGTGWDGTFKGEILPPDVYMYILDVECSTGESFKFKGDISLVR